VETAEGFAPTQRLPPSFTPRPGPPHAYDAVAPDPLDATDEPPLRRPLAEQRLAKLKEAHVRGDNEMVQSLLQEASP